MGAKDETWVLYDRQLVDDELYKVWGALQPGVRVFVLSDSCHSGSVTRDIFDAALPQIVANGMVDGEDPQDQGPADRRAGRHIQEQRGAVRRHPALEAGRRQGRRRRPRSYLISGCQDNQLSLDGERNGLFTQQLLGVWNDGKYKGNYRRFWKAIGKKMPPTQTPNFYPVGASNQAFDRQNPLTI